MTPTQCPPCSSTAIYHSHHTNADAIPPEIGGESPVGTDPRSPAVAGVESLSGADEQSPIGNVRECPMVEADGESSLGTDRRSPPPDVTKAAIAVGLSQLCGCTGVRSCKLCADSERVARLRSAAAEDSVKYAGYRCYYYDSRLRCAIRDDGLSASASFDDIQRKTSQAPAVVEGAAAAERLTLAGLTLVHDFVDAAEEARLLARIDRVPWKPSQSGRRKQDYGPKVNFKQQKVKADGFDGLPEYADALLHKIGATVAADTTATDAVAPAVPLPPPPPFVALELCNLEYLASRRSAIEMHKDDSWIWGERLVSINLLSDTVISLENAAERRLVFVLLPRRSMLVMADVVRHGYMHGIFAHHIIDRRLAITVREAADSFKVGGANFERYGRELAERAKLRVSTQTATPTPYCDSTVSPNAICA